MDCSGLLLNSSYLARIEGKIMKRIRASQRLCQRIKKGKKKDKLVMCVTTVGQLSNSACSRTLWFTSRVGKVQRGGTYPPPRLAELQWTKHCTRHSPPRRMRSFSQEDTIFYKKMYQTRKDKTCEYLVLPQDRLFFFFFIARDLLMRTSALLAGWALDLGSSPG